MDESRRALARLAEAIGDPAVRARLLAEHRRAGGLLPEQLELLAWLGDEAALTIVTLDRLPDAEQIGTSWQHGSGRAETGASPRRSLGLWTDELFRRFGRRVAVRAALAGLGPWLDGRRLGRRQEAALLACRTWVEEPTPARAEACARAGDRLGEPQGPGTEGTWAVIRMCQAIGASWGLPDLVFAMTSAADALGDVDRSTERVRAAVRAALVPWALETREVITDAGTLQGRARGAIEREDPGEALSFASRAVAAAGDDPTSWSVQAQARRARGDLQGALADLERCLSLGPRDSDPLRIQGLILADLGQRERAIASLQRYLDRVEVRFTENGRVTFRGPPGAQEARAALARLGAAPAAGAE